MDTVDSCILYEDAQILVCHKPQGLAVQSAGFGKMDLESGLKNYLAEKHPGKLPYLGLVHRLDQPVEGLVVFGKTPQAAADLSRQITEGKMEKDYLAISTHLPKERQGILEHTLVKDGRKHISQVVPDGTKGGKRARLAYQLLEEKNEECLLEIHLFTGRHHQIRVQMAAAGMPLLGDRKYNPEECGENAKNLALCAYRLSFVHPKNKRPVRFEIQPENPAFWPFFEEKQKK